MTIRQAATEILTEAGRSPEHIALVLQRVERMLNDGPARLDSECSPQGKENLRQIMATLRSLDAAVPGSAKTIAQAFVQKHNSEN